MREDHPAQPGRRPRPTERGDRGGGDLHGPHARSVEAGDQVEQGGLPASRGADQTDELTGGHVEGDVLEGHHPGDRVPVPLRHAGQPDRWRRPGWPRGGSRGDRGHAPANFALPSPTWSTPRRPGSRHPTSPGSSTWDRSTRCWSARMDEAMGSLVKVMFDHAVATSPAFSGLPVSVANSVLASAWAFAGEALRKAVVASWPLRRPVTTAG